DEWLGTDAARWFLMDVLRVTSSGLAAGRSLSHIEDRIEAALLEHLQTTDPRVLQSVAAHSTIIASLTGRIRDTLIKASGDDSFPGSARTAELARRWSTPADQLAAESSQRSHCAPRTQQRH